MFIIHEAKLVNNKIARAREILEIAEKESKSRFSFQISRLFEHRNLSLQIEWNEARTRLQNKQETYLSDFSQRIARSIDSRIAEADGILLQESDLRAQSVTIEKEVSRALDRELRTIRDCFENMYQEVRAMGDKLVESDKQSVDLQARQQLTRVEELNRSHLTRILELHSHEEDRLTTYFQNLIRNNAGTIADLESRISRLENAVEEQEASISRLTDENQVVSQPLAELESRRVRLKEKLEIVDAGTIAHVNFRRSVHTLEKRLSSIETGIDEAKRAVDILLSHDQHVLS
jgi:chromosome segregation ATPase